MAYKLMVSIQKGGVGKTTTSAVIAELMAASGYKVLVLDLDSQGNTTLMLTQESIYKNSGRTILEAIKEDAPEKYTIHVKDNLDLLPAEDMLSTFSRYIYNSGRSNVLNVIKNAIEPVESEYDFIIMDCPPNLGDIVLNAIVYADYVIIPVNPDAFGTDALDRYVDFVESAKAEGHTRAKVLGIALTMIDRRISSEKLISADIRRSYGDKVFKTDILKKARLKDFALMGVTMERKADIEALDEYIKLTEEVLERVKSEQIAGKIK